MLHPETAAFIFWSPPLDSLFLQVWPHLLVATLRSHCIYFCGRLKSRVKEVLLDSGNQGALWEEETCVWFALASEVSSYNVLGTDGQGL